VISLHRREATTQSPDKGPDAGHAARHSTMPQTALDNNTPLLSGPWTVDKIRPDLADERGRFHVAGDARWVAARRRDVAISPATMRRVGTVPSREESALSHPRPCKPLDPRAEACAGEVPVRSGQGRLLQGAHLVSVPVTVTGVAVSAPLSPRSWDFAPLRIVRVVARNLLDLFLVPYLVIDGGPAGPPP
jgi:hypothetical protein